MKSLVNRLPSREIHFANWPHIKDLQLADPNFNQIGPVDIFLGTEVCSELILPGLIKGPSGTPTALQTELGWILFGKAYENSIGNQVSINTTTVNLETLMEKFIEIENISEDRLLTPDEQYCVDFYNTNTRRDENGVFVVKLPFKTPSDPKAILGKSRDNALRQFLQLERRFAHDANFKAEYSENINGFLLQGHMNELFDTEEDRLYYTEDGLSAYDSYYLPHHAVIKEDSTTTRMRPVFNAGKASSNEHSLNSVLFQGPALQNDLVAILINWRFHEIGFVADIQQMYRRIRVIDEDITFQRILWRNDPSEKIKEYGLNRLAFGTNYAPCGAIQTVFKLAEQNQDEFPNASRTIRKDMYVDDCISGASNVESALQLQKDLLHIFNSARMVL